MRRAHPEFDPAFSAEWGRRMLAAYNPAEYTAAMAPICEKYLTVEDLQQLIVVQQLKNQGKQAELPPSVTAKLKANAIVMQSEILGACGQVGALVGGTIGQQIETEHPEWFQPKSK